MTLHTVYMIIAICAGLVTMAWTIVQLIDWFRKRKKK